MIGKLLGVVTAGGTLAGVALLRRMFIDAANIIMLAVVSAFMFSILLAGGFFAAYLCLVHYGLDPYASGITVGLAAFATTIVLFVLTVYKLNKLRDLTHRSLSTHEHSFIDISNLTHAFIDGFTNGKK